MKQSKPPYLRLFLSTFQLSACTFGGGFVIIPLMRRKFVEKLHWLEEDEMMDLTAIAQSSPGAIAVNASILVGYRVAGVPGALVTVLGTILPPLIIISVISFFYAAFRDDPAVDLAMKGMLAGVAAVIADVTVTLTQGVAKTRRALPLVILAAAFIAVQFFGVSVIPILLAAGTAGAADAYLRARRTKEGDR